MLMDPRNVIDAGVMMTAIREAEAKADEFAVKDALRALAADVEALPRVDVMDKFWDVTGEAFELRQLVKGYRKELKLLYRERAELEATAKRRDKWTYDFIDGVYEQVTELLASAAHERTFTSGEMRKRYELHLP